MKNPAHDVRLPPLGPCRVGPCPWTFGTFRFKRVHRTEVFPYCAHGVGRRWKSTDHQRFQRTRLCGQRATSQRRCYAKQALPVAAGSRGGSRGRVSTPSNSRRGRSRWRDTCPALSRTISVGFKAQPWSGGIQVSDRMFHAVGAGKRRTPESWRFGQGLKRRASPGSPPDCGRQV